MAYEPLHHKYRPQTFADLVGQEAIAQTLTNAILQSRIAPAYLFSGPRGTGKTSSARILAKSLNCQSGDAPTPQPCGTCEACRSIVLGSALDVIEIDAASNTGVDNIRELIEKAQFAPVQCRFKVYVIDECLTGDTRVQTKEGLMRIDDPSIQGKQVLSYNETSEKWEYKPVVRWLDQGDRQTYTIKTNHRKIQCTGNHLIRMAQGWVAAKDVKEKAKILSPVNAAMGSPSTDIAAPVWTTNFEIVESIEISSVEPVYDIEVEGHHNFVANGLLVHNCHMLSTAAFNALLKTLEEPPDRVVFVLATTDPQRVLPTIISRCQRFDYRRIPLESMVSHLQLIAQQEQIDIEAEALTLVAQLAQGGLRDAESLLDQLSLLPPPISVEAVWDLVGAVPERELLSLVEAIASNNPEAVIDRARNLMNRGREPLIVLQNLASFYRDLLIAKTAPQRNDLVAITSSTWEQLLGFVKNLDVALLLQGQQHLRSSEVQLKNTTQPRLWLEVTLMGLLPGAIAPSAGLAAGAAARSMAGSMPTPVAAVLPKSVPSAAQSSQIVPPPPVPPAPVRSATASSATSSQATPQVPSQQSLASAAPGPGASSPGDLQGDALEGSPEDSPEDSIDFVDLWQRAIASIEYFSTQALLRQQGQLQSYDGAVAKIGVPTQWMSNLQGKLPALEAAFAQAAGRPIKVQFEPPNQTPLARFASSAPPGGTVVPASSSQPSPAPPRPAPQPEASPHPQEPASPPPRSAAPPVINPAPAAPATDAPRPAVASPLPAPPSAAPVPSAQNPAPQQPTTQRPVNPDWDEGELLRAAKSLAQFFNGEVVQEGALPEVGSSVGVSSSQTPLETPPLGTATPEGWSDGVTPTEPEDDDDVPF